MKILNKEINGAQVAVASVLAVAAAVAAPKAAAQQVNPGSTSNATATIQPGANRVENNVTTAARRLTFAALLGGDTASTAPMCASTANFFVTAGIVGGGKAWTTPLVGDKECDVLREQEEKQELCRAATDQFNRYVDVNTDNARVMAKAAFDMMKYTCDRAVAVTIENANKADKNCKAQGKQVSLFDDTCEAKPVDAKPVAQVTGHVGNAPAAAAPQTVKIEFGQVPVLAAPVAAPVPAPASRTVKRAPAKKTTTDTGPCAANFTQACTPEQKQRANVILTAPAAPASAPAGPGGKK